jgi:hypothetical protein
VSQDTQTASLKAHAMAAADRVLLEIQAIQKRYESQATITTLTHLTLANLFIEGVSYGSEAVVRVAESNLKKGET